MKSGYDVLDAIVNTMDEFNAGKLDPSAVLEHITEAFDDSEWSLA